MKQKVEERIIAPKEIIIGEANAKVKLVEYGDYSWKNMQGRLPIRSVIFL